MRFSGIPHNPNPPTRSLAPSGMSCTHSVVLAKNWAALDNGDSDSHRVFCVCVCVCGVCVICVVCVRCTCVDDCTRYLTTTIALGYGVYLTLLTCFTACKCVPLALSAGERIPFAKAIVLMNF